jgi:putative ATP-dependent endonuclease of OLD family
VIDGRGNNEAVQISEYLLDLGYEVLLLHDTDVLSDADPLRRLEDKGGAVEGWQSHCATEERIFLDVPWKLLLSLLDYAVECEGADSVLAVINQECCTAGLTKLENLHLDCLLDCEPFRRALGRAAKRKKRPWFKTIERGERLGGLIGPTLESIATSPLAKGLERLRKWIDA